MINKSKKREKAATQDIDTADKGDVLDGTTQEDADTINGKSEDESNEDLLQKQLAESKKACDEYVDRLQRLAAEFDNFRKRTAREKTSMYDDGCKDTIAKMLPIVDNFERAMPDLDESESADPFYKGMQMVLKQLKGIMTELDVTEIPALGLTFDTNVHFAVAHEDNEQAGDNEVVEVMQKGYMHKDKVLRYSMVKVAN